MKPSLNNETLTAALEKCLKNEDYTPEERELIKQLIKDIKTKNWLNKAKNWALLARFLYDIFGP